MKIGAAFQGLSDTANTGLNFLTRDYRAAPANEESITCFSSTEPSNQAPDQVGYTSPNATYDRMRGLNADALRLDANTHTFVTTNNPTQNVYRASWNAWFEAWKPFYEKYAGPNATVSAKLSAALSSDALAQEVDRRQAQFDALAADYALQKRPDGSLVPPFRRAAPPTPPSGGGGLALPWWFWTLAGVAVVGFGYLVYRKVQEGIAKKRYVDKQAPKILERFIGPYAKPAYEYHEAGRRDPPHAPPSSRMSRMSHMRMRDPNVAALPLPKPEPTLLDMDYYLEGQSDPVYVGTSPRVREDHLDYYADDYTDDIDKNGNSADDYDDYEP